MKPTNQNGTARPGYIEFGVLARGAGLLLTPSRSLPSTFRFLLLHFGFPCTEASLRLSESEKVSCTLVLEVEMMASALGRVAMVGARGVTSTGSSRRVGLASAGRGFKTNPHVEVRKAIMDKMRNATPVSTLCAPAPIANTYRVAW